MSVSRSLETLSQCSLMTPWRRTTEMSWRSTEASLGVSFEMFLRRRCNGQKDVATTSSRRPLAKWCTYRVKNQTGTINNTVGAIVQIFVLNLVKWNILSIDIAIKKS